MHWSNRNNLPSYNFLDAQKWIGLFIFCVLTGLRLDPAFSQTWRQTGVTPYNPADHTCVEKAGQLPPCSFGTGLPRGTCVGEFPVVRSDRDGAKVLYKGDFCGGKRHGVGSLLDGYGRTLYSGRFYNGSPHGEGVESLGKSIYTGEFQGGYFHGRGKLTRHEGVTYEGDFQFNFYSGRGSLLFPNGVRIAGQFLYGQSNGEIEVVWPDGRKFVGESRKNAFLHGIYTIPNGSKFVGKMSGSGRDIKDMLEAIKAGQGTLHLPDGRRFVGTFHNDLPHEDGILYASNGSVSASGLWRQGELSKSYPLELEYFPFSNANDDTSALFKPNPDSVRNCTGVMHNCYFSARVGSFGERVQGTYWRGELHGYGTVVGSSDTKEGQFRNGQLNGKGWKERGQGSQTREVPSQRREGDFRNGELNGFGTFTNETNGKCSMAAPRGMKHYIGQFLNDLPHGEGVGEFCEGQLVQYRYVGQWTQWGPAGVGVLYHMDGKVKSVGFWGLGIDSYEGELCHGESPTHKNCIRARRGDSAELEYLPGTALHATTLQRYPFDFQPKR